ncbi:unnamed protein product, partial [Symbiodinium microadriaticum]
MTPYEEAPAKEDAEILLEPLEPQPEAPATRTSQFGWAARARWLLLGTGALNVPANCVANIAVFNGALSVLMQSTLAGDAVCVKFEKKKDRAKIEATQFLKRQGYDVAVLPRPAAIGNRAVYSSINRCVFQTILGTTFVMKAAILLGDSSIHCYPGTDKQRVCAVDIMGLFAVLSLA